MKIAKLDTGENVEFHEAQPINKPTPSDILAQEWVCLGAGRVESIDGKTLHSKARYRFWRKPEQENNRDKYTVAVRLRDIAIKTATGRKIKCPVCREEIKKESREMIFCSAGCLEDFKELKKKL